MIKLIFLLCLYSVAIASHFSYDGNKVYSVSIKTMEDFFNTKKFENEHGIDFWEPLKYKSNSISRIMVEPNQQQYFEDQLNEFGISFKIIIENVEEIFHKEREIQIVQKAKIKFDFIQPASTINFQHFWTSNEINLFLFKLVETYPELISVESIGKTNEGREINSARISLNGKGNVDGSRPIILIDATIHAREWIAPMMAIHLINELVVNSAQNIALLQGIDWIIVPVVNVDGYVFSHEQQRLWRKTRSINPNSTCVGVDPNRNFDFQWNTPGGSSTNQCREDYRGPHPASEVEVVALANLMRKYNNTVFYVALHSFGDYLLYPYGYAFKLVVNHEQHHSVGLLGINAIFAVSGNRYSLGGAADLLYLASGGQDDYASAVGKIPIVYTMELPGGGPNGFDIPVSRINGVAAETFAAFTEWAKYVKNTWAK